jgi:hypothetical protein
VPHPCTVQDTWQPKTTSSHANVARMTNSLWVEFLGRLKVVRPWNGGLTSRCMSIYKGKKRSVRAPWHRNNFFHTTHSATTGTKFETHILSQLA